MNADFTNDSATNNANADNTAGNDVHVARTSPDQNHYNTLTLDMIRIRLFDSLFLPLAGAPYRATLGDAIYEDTADADAWAEIHIQGAPEQCKLEWGRDEETDDYLYQETIYLDFPPEDPDLALNRRLQNLGYSDPLALCQDCQWDDPACVSPRLEQWHSDPDTVEPKPKYTMQGPPDDSEHPDAQQDAAPLEDAETSQPKDMGTVIVDAIKSAGKAIGIGF